jgi:RNase P/RNase MRP subunit p29
MNQTPDNQTPGSQTPGSHTPTGQTPDDFAQIGSDADVDAALQPKKTLNLPMATAILTGIVVLAGGLAGGAGLHAAFASDSTSIQTQAGRGMGAGGYGGFRGQGLGPGGQAGQGNAAVGTVVSANNQQLVVKTQTGDVTVKLTGETTFEITSTGTAADLKAGQQVVITGETTDGTLTARSIRQGEIPTGFGRTPTATPATR